MPGRGAQPPVADVADAEAVLGDRRQQRHGAAEQHGEQVEGDGAEQHRLAADEAQPLEGVVQRRPLVGRRALLGWRTTSVGTTMAAARRSRPAATTYGDGRIDVVEEAAGRRADDQAELPRGRVQGDQPGQPAGRRDQRWQRAERRRGERAGHAEQRGDGEDRHGRRRVAGARTAANSTESTHLADEADGGDPAPVEAVGRRAGQRQQQQGGQELDEAEQAERQLAVGDVVHLLAERGGLQRTCRPSTRWPPGGT